MYTTVNEQTGKRHPKFEPFRTLKTYRPITEFYGLRPCFGVWYKVIKPGRVSLGDTIWLANKNGNS